MFIIFFILGLIIGSFLNVVVYRLSLAETLLGRSHCPHCKTTVRWYDNIPLVSFVLLKAQCRDCRKKISWQYPLAELLTGIVFAATADFFFVLADAQTWLPTVFLLVIFSILLIIFLYDLNFMEIPMLVLWIGVVWMILYFIVSDWALISDYSERGISGSELFFSLNTFSGIIGGLVAFLFFFSLAYFSKEKWMGLGDGYVGLLVGMIVGWPNILIALLLSFTIGAVFSLALLVMKRKTMKSQIPFAPFLVAGTMLAIFLHQAFPEFGYYFGF